MGNARVEFDWGVWVSRSAKGFVVLSGLLHVACGETARDGQLMTNTAGSAGASGATGSAASSGAAGSAGAASAGAASAGAASAGAASAGAASVEAPVQISGRWAMFNFEDPVGVFLNESDAGSLTGRGCAAGAPGVPTLDEEVRICGDVVGAVSGTSATFGFAFEDGTPGGYSTKVTVSRDAQRMTGTFGNGAGEGTFSVAWLRVPDGALWLESVSPDQVESWAGSYDLQLVTDDSDGGEYVFGRTYRLIYSRRTISGDLGAYWSSEISRPTGDSIQVGPVPATAPELPTLLKLDFDAQGFTTVQATTASGHVYEFGATRP